MATIRISLSFSLILVASVLPPSLSLTCTSQKFSSNNLYANCTDLPKLNAYLHWSYNASNSSLSIAFLATPPKPDGWVAWAINPTGQGMSGSQALIAWQSKSSVVVKTFSISSYTSIAESKLSFDVWDLSAEESNGTITIFASVKVPEKAEEVNQVWQVGPSVVDGRPTKHDFEEDNLSSKGTLVLVSKAQSSTNATTGSGSGSNNTENNSNGSSDSTRKGRSGSGIIVGLLWFIAAIYYYY